MGSQSASERSDKQLLDRLDELARRERRGTVAILETLAQVDRRRAWAGLGHSSTYDYCRRRLLYSESAANRRLRTARVLARHPHIAARLITGRLTLCAVSRVARLVLERHHDALLQKIEGKRLDHIDAIIASFRPRHQPVPDRIQVMTVERTPIEPASKTEPTVEPDTDPTRLRRATRSPIDDAPEPKADDEPDSTRASDADSPPAPDATSQEMSPPHPTQPAKSEHPLQHPQSIPSPPSQQPSQPKRIERYFKFAFAVDAGAMSRFTRAQAIASSKLRRSVGLAELFALLCDTYLDRHDPVRRARRRASKAENTDTPPSPPTTPPPSTPSSSPTRHIPHAVRDLVYQRDGGRCTFVAPDGTRCQATQNLHIDHIHPFAAGGTHDPANLRLLCPAHNRLAAERYFGRDMIERHAQEKEQSGA